MGFLDKAKAAATDLAAKADSAINSGLGSHAPGGDSESLLRDLGVIAYLEATGRQAPPEKDRVMAALRAAEQQGQLRSFALKTTPPVAPPPPGYAGAAGAVPPPPAGGAVPPPPAGAPVPPPAPPAPGAAPYAPANAEPPAPPAPPTEPSSPPPPPSWA